MCFSLKGTGTLRNAACAAAWMSHKAISVASCFVMLLNSQVRSARALGRARNGNATNVRMREWQGAANYTIVLSFASTYGMNNFFQFGGTPPLELFTCDTSVATGGAIERARHGERDAIGA